jgi:hypothetical protein
LVAKSLVVTGGKGAVTRYRLLDTTRAYALEKLEESGERERLSHHHAEYHRQLLERAEVEWETRPTAEWLDDYGWCIDNLRAALDWAFSPAGDASIGVALTAAAVPLWMHLSLFDECRGRAEQTLAVLSGGASPDTRREMKLHSALGTSLRYTRGDVPEISAEWTIALGIAESLDDAEYQLLSLWGLWTFSNHQRPVSPCFSTSRKILFPSGEAARSERPAHRRANDRCVAILPGRPAQRAAPPPARARG